MTSAENTALKEVLIFIKEDEARFINWAVLQYDPFFYTFHATTGWQAKLFQKYKENPNKGSRIITFGRVLDSHFKHSHHWHSPEVMIKVFERVTKRYWKRVKRRMLATLKKQSHNNTQIMQELLKRGWVHEEDVRVDNLDQYRVYAGGFHISWKEGFVTWDEAKQIQHKWGIPNYTSILTL